jgi:hypothetical protein
MLLDQFLPLRFIIPVGLFVFRFILEIGLFQGTLWERLMKLGPDFFYTASILNAFNLLSDQSGFWEKTQGVAGKELCVVLVTLFHLIFWCSCLLLYRKAEPVLNKNLKTNKDLIIAIPCWSISFLLGFFALVTAYWFQ